MLVHIEETSLTNTLKVKPFNESANKLFSSERERTYWTFFGKAIARIHPLYGDVQVNVLKTTWLEEWNLSPQTVLRNNITSIKTLCDVCV